MRSINRHLRQRGDTLVEVLLAMVVVGLSLGVAYGIANRAIATGRIAQERTEATELAESQLELLKNNINPDPIVNPMPIDYTSAASPFCITTSNPVGDANDPTECSFGFYNLRMEYTSSSRSYRSIVTWDVPTSSEDAIVEIIYRP